MTSEIITRAEKAIRANRHNTTEVQAREAIRAIRALTPEMSEAALKALPLVGGGYLEPDDLRRAWFAAIDVALKP